MLTMTIFPRESPHAHHCAACFKNGIPVLGRRTLASDPHHNQVLWLDLGLYDLVCDCMRRIHDKHRSDSFCGARTAWFTIIVQTLLPREKKLPIDQDDHWTGEFGVRLHHGGMCADGHSYQVGIIRIPSTSFTSNNKYVCQLLALSGRSHMKILNIILLHSMCPMGGLHVDTDCHGTYPSISMVLFLSDFAHLQMMDVAVAYQQCLHCVICPSYLLPSIKSRVVFYVADEADTLISYSCLINSSVIVLNVLPTILTKLNCVFQACQHSLQKPCKFLKDMFFKRSPTPPTHLLDLGVWVACQG